MIEIESLISKERMKFPKTVVRKLDYYMQKIKLNLCVICHIIYMMNSRGIEDQLQR